MDQDYVDNMPAGGWALDGPRRSMPKEDVDSLGVPIPGTAPDELVELISANAADVATFLRVCALDDEMTRWLCGDMAETAVSA